ncbi:GNAT family N-acetyltransferase [Lysinibacillus sphaericus]|uniref:Alanine acetyltransferase n=2 Tax=Lysinibacillus TaxID=400634 RepID=A0A2S0JWD6_LYSSH|nr:MULTISPECIES: GNAT family protein [Lysinibacillus]AHN23501.1 GCN5 family acetyltransferase [Lysinibacillus varians]AVK95254.1 alanine acetyltransferase [Lysinibacillus sphaericus]MCS1381640.1 GNAT family N-acetyltransferase [Lysinibacillus sphaericus]MED4545101.1 GNAT family protein [Lysinibacillus sphaericus]OEC03356.1 alanine acetyltransferase [Lysinibacillus sphaericus]
MFRYSINEHTYLKMLDLNDVEELFALTDRSRETLREWLPFVDNVKTVKDTEQFVRNAMQQYADHNGIQAGIYYDGKLAGVIGYHQVNWQHKWTSIGYWLGNEFVGNGLVTNSMRAFIDFAFEYLKLNRIEVRVAVGNIRSRTIPKVLGFNEEGRLRDAEWLYDHYVDQVVYGLTAVEWKKIKMAKEATVVL